MDMMQLCSQLAAVKGLSFHLSAVGGGMPIFMLHLWGFSVTCASSHSPSGWESDIWEPAVHAGLLQLYIGMSSQVVTT